MADHTHGLAPHRCAGAASSPRYARVPAMTGRPRKGDEVTTRDRPVGEARQPGLGFGGSGLKRWKPCRYRGSLYKYIQISMISSLYRFEDLEYRNIYIRYAAMSCILNIFVSGLSFAFFF